VASIQHVERVLPDEFNRATLSLPLIVKFPESSFDKQVLRGGRTRYKVKFDRYDITQAEWMDKVDLPKELVAEFERMTIERRKHPVVMKADVRAKEIGDSETKVPTDGAKKHPLLRKFPTISPKKGFYVDL